MTAFESWAAGRKTLLTFNEPVLIVASNASDRFGGEAVLPLHYFRGLLDRGIDVWLVTHARVRAELTESLGANLERVVFIEDTWLHRLFWRIGSWMPQRVGWAWNLATLDLVTQFSQRAIVRGMVRTHGIRIIHQPTPVSPRAPSLIFGVGAPVIIGPMNGGMEYPPHFRKRFESGITRCLIYCGRILSHGVNLLVPGKHLAARLLVANSRTRQALPFGCKRRVATLVENGVNYVDSPPAAERQHRQVSSSPISFVFVGRLVDWKGVDLLLEAFANLARQDDTVLKIIGDGPERPRLQAIAQRHGIEAQTQFKGFLPRDQCIDAIRSATAMVLPSLLECGGAVVLEAMSVGTPVIATDWGGPSDYLDDTCGVLIPPCSHAQFVADLSAAMHRLAVDPDRAAEIGLCGLERARSLFTWQAKIDRMIDHYDSIACGEAEGRIQQA
jgi:glycosyltransferase involved in cell wall biosynthesis